MAHQQNRRLCPGAFQPGHHVAAILLHSEELPWNRFPFKNLLHVFCDYGFVAGRAGGVDFQEGSKMLEGFGFHLSPIDCSGSGDGCRGARRRCRS
jgi:hypothetical protein